MQKNIWRAVIEVGLIIFLIYSNLLMGKFERFGDGVEEGSSLGNRGCSYRCQF